MNITKYFPLLVPALKPQDSCEVEYSLLRKRVATVAIPIILGCLIAVSAVGSLSLLGLTLIPIIGRIDSVLTERAADHRAVDQYIGQPSISPSATLRIRTHLRAAQLLINKNGDLNRTNEDGGFLIDIGINFQVFKLLIDNGINLKCLNQHDVPAMFTAIIAKSDPGCLEYVLNNRNIGERDFTLTQRQKFLGMLGSERSFELLDQHGFFSSISDVEKQATKVRFSVLNHKN